MLGYRWARGAVSVNGQELKAGDGSGGIEGNEVGNQR